MIKLWLFIVCAAALAGMLNGLAIAIHPLIAVCTISLTLGYFHYVTHPDGPLGEYFSLPEVEGD